MRVGVLFRGRVRSTATYHPEKTLQKKQTFLSAKAPPRNLPELKREYKNRNIIKHYD